jgi:hypothetical protein
MEMGPFWGQLIDFLSPTFPILKRVHVFHPYIATIILGFIVIVFMKGHMIFESLRGETEDLLKRYIIFRGKKHTVLRETNATDDAEDILRSISRSWAKLRSYVGKKRDLQQQNYAWVKRVLGVGVAVLLLNTFREGIYRLLLAGAPSGLVRGVLEDIPLYLLVVLTMVLLVMQRRVIGRTSSEQVGTVMEVLLADLDGQDLSLYDEFDPLEEDDGEDSV